MKIIIIALLIALLICSYKWLRYYSATVGLLGYLITNHNDDLSCKEAMEITDKAFKTIIRDFLGLR